jgi:high-affinity nickel-transport protein
VAAFDLTALISAATSPAGVGVLLTGFFLGMRHGIDWDHIAAITDITSTTTVSDAAADAHRAEHKLAVGHDHPHGGPAEMKAHAAPPPGAGPGAMLAAGAFPGGGVLGMLRVQRHPIILGTLYALGHALVVVLLGLAALLFGASLPDWIDPIMARIVGLTLLALGVYVLVSLYRYARHGQDFHLRSRWMLVFDGVRYAWQRFQARIHGHVHVEPLEATSYGPRTAFAVGMIHGVGAETASQVLIIAAVGGAASAGLGIPMLFAFVAGLVISNTLIVVISATGFVASQTRQRIYVVVGLFAGVFSLFVGLVFFVGAEQILPDLQRIFGFLG